ncbi:hypothetical protein ACFQYP_51655 [Nonomuraea antimicrobica]
MTPPRPPPRPRHRRDHPVRRRLIDFATANDVRLVDAADALASADAPELPDPSFFLDHIHLSDEGVERVMARVADAVLGVPDGTTAPGPGADPKTRALSRALAAGYRALRNQPESAVREQVDLALRADEKNARDFITKYLDILETPGPRWTHSALTALHADPQTRQVCYQIAQTREHSPGYWAFREVVQEALGRRPDPGLGGWDRIDLLGLPDGRGFRVPNFAPGTAYYEATTERTTLRLALAAPVGGTLHLTHRLPSGTAHVSVNGTSVGRLPTASAWARTTIEVPESATREGVNSVEIHWPVPEPGYEAFLAADASALARRLFPRVLPVFGALFTAVFETEGARPSAVRASRVSASTGWPVRL